MSHLADLRFWRWAAIVIASLFVMVGVSRVFVSQGLPLWGAGSKVAIHFHFPPLTSGPLIEGWTSWDDPVEDALREWTRYIPQVEFEVVRNSTAPMGQRNGISNVRFTNDGYGARLDEHVVAVCFSWSQGGKRTETDVSFSDRANWEAFRVGTGPHPQGLTDIYRVALHEFGHAMGLGHPNEAGQNVYSIMTSAGLGNVDSLQLDDLAGVLSLYGPSPPTIKVQPTSKSAVARGRVTFRFQPKANPVPTIVWQVSANGGSSWSDVPDIEPYVGAKTATLTIIDVTPDMNGNQYRASVANTVGTIHSDEAILTVTSTETYIGT